MSNGSREEDRQFRVLDQTTTAYSILRDRYSRRGTALNAVVLVGSIVVTVLAIASNETLKVVGITDSDAARAWMGIAGILLMVASVLEIKYDWMGKSRLYGHAAETCGRLKGRYREAIEGEDPSQHGRLEDVRREYLLTMTWLPRIPETQFLPLKARHRQKIAMSRFLDEHPYASTFVVGVIFKVRDTRTVLRAMRPK